tara:strand:- start:110 stop:307 length:198 start_codon:yes stop_codon:yes gene_type:complete
MMKSNINPRNKKKKSLIIIMYHNARPLFFAKGRAFLRNHQGVENLMATKGDSRAGKQKPKRLRFS